MMSQLAELIELNGEDTPIYRRTESGTDEFNRSVYTWAVQATEKAWVQSIGRSASVGEIFYPAGELTVDDRVGYFKHDSVIQEDDQVVWKENRYDVKSVQPQRLSGSTIFKVAVLKRQVE